MRIVTGEDGNRVDVWVVDDLIVGRSRIRKAKFLCRVLGMKSARGGNADELNFFDILDGRL